MNIEMAMLPGLVRATERQVCIVVDVLRATTTLCALFERGVLEVYLGADPTDVKAIAARLGDCLMAGERGGLAPEGFDFGNSPAQVLAAANLAGRRVAFCTTNGTKALRQLIQQGAPLVLAGCLRNGAAVAEVAFNEAQRMRCDITVVASGRGHGTNLALDDTVAAGYIVYLLRQLAGLDEMQQTASSESASAAAEADDLDYIRLQARSTAYNAAGELDAEAQQRAAGARYAFVPYDAGIGGAGSSSGLGSNVGDNSDEVRMAEEGATMALRLYLSFVGADDPAHPSRHTLLAAFNETSAGHHLLRYGWAADTLAASEAGVATVVPVVSIEGGELVVREIN
jgi:2-phosphosulfolactate phosphatase